MNKIKGRGQLQHHFWGEYKASMVLVFDSPESANDALAVLGKAWKLHSKEPRALTWFGDSNGLDFEKGQLVGFGANRKKIDSVAKSIDYGEEFFVEIPVVAAEQMKLL